MPSTSTYTDPWAHLFDAQPNFPALNSFQPTTAEKSSEPSNLQKGIGAAAPIFASLFGPSNPYPQKELDLATQLQAFGKDMSAKGANALDPVLKYLTTLVGGDPGAMLAATLPERGRIIDQYDTARKTVERNSPRGGGMTQELASLGTKQASDLAATTAKARSDAVTNLGDIGKTLTTVGGQEQATGLDAALKAFQKLSDDKNATSSAIGSAIGTILPYLLMAFL